MARIEKLMSLSAAEFAASWRCFDASTAPTPGNPVRLPVGGGTVEIGFAPQPGVRLGGLLTLPRAVVSFIFTGVDRGEQAALVLRFDRAFQRGGG